MQDLVTSGVLKLKKIGTHENTSDLMTKYLSADVTFNHSASLGVKDSERHFIGN